VRKKEKEGGVGQRGKEREKESVRQLMDPARAGRRKCEWGKSRGHEPQGA